jgi:hypothetical protein
MAGGRFKLTGFRVDLRTVPNRLFLFTDKQIVSLDYPWDGFRAQYPRGIHSAVPKWHYYAVRVQRDVDDRDIECNLEPAA